MSNYCYNTKCVPPYQKGLSLIWHGNYQENQNKKDHIKNWEALMFIGWDEYFTWAYMFGDEAIVLQGAEAVSAGRANGWLVVAEGGRDRRTSQAADACLFCSHTRETKRRSASGGIFDRSDKHDVETWEIDLAKWSAFLFLLGFVKKGWPGGSGGASSWLTGGIASSYRTYT